MTDPSTYPHPERLHQDDDVFYAMIVHFGSMGVALSYAIRVIDLYWVRETNSAFVFPDDFPEVLKRAKAGENLSVTIHPYATLPGGKHRGLLNRFERLTKAQVDAIDPDLWDNPPTRPDDQELLAVLSGVFGTQVIGQVMGSLPQVFLHQVELYLERSAGNKFLSVYYKTYPRSTADHFRAIFSEACVPIDALLGTARQAFAHAQKAADEGEYHYLVPFALRFIGASEHFISMHYGRDSATLESFVVKGVPKADEAMHDLEKALPQARPHWGQMHWFDVPAAQHYPESWDRWLAQYRRRNASGLFNCPTTDLLGIST